MNGEVFDNTCFYIQQVCLTFFAYRCAQGKHILVFCICSGLQAAAVNPFSNLAIVGELPDSEICYYCLCPGIGCGASRGRVTHAAICYTAALLSSSLLTVRQQNYILLRNHYR